MKTQTAVRGLATLAVAASATLAGAQDGGSGTSNDAMEAMMKAMQERTREATSVGEHHQRLAQLLGDWEVEIALVMPGMEPQRTAGTATYSWVIEGRWLGQRVTGTMMGMPYEGFALMGYDSYAKNHVVASVNSVDTALIVARGVVVDPTGKTSAAYGTLDEYTTDELGKPFKVVTRIVDEGRHVVEVWDLGIGVDGAKVLEFAFRRKQD